MKSKIQLDDLELFVISKRNKVESFEGNTLIEALIKDYFEKPISIITSGKDDNKFKVNSSVAKTLMPGSRDYIMSVLIEKIQNELGAEIIYNIEEDK